MVTGESEKVEPKPKLERRALTWALRVGLALAGVSAGLAITEWMFARRDDGAFPHLNVYEADPVLGVRLAPGATQELRFGGNNPKTHVAINAQGFRGSDWPAPEPDEILIVGDSQVFGLGVEAEETFSARLAEETGRPVRNAGVPTYGPLEFGQLLARLVPERKPKTVIYVVNMANDLFEARRPNTERHAVWDGWAVRKETAPLETASFPGRAWLYRESHAFYALRRVIYEAAHPKIEDFAMPSEGTWRDFTAGAAGVSGEKKRQRREFERLAELQRDEVEYAEQRAVQADLEVEKRFYEELEGVTFDVRAARANPGDITSSGPGEGGSPLAGSVEQIRAAILYRNRLENELRALIPKADPAKRELIEASFKARELANARLDELRTTAPQALVRSMSPLATPIEEAKRLCDEHGAELVVVVLPIDVQVSADEWKKYPDQEPVETKGTEIFLDDLAEHAISIGAKGLNALSALQQAEPGAFLDGDLHMTPKGHSALAAAIASTMSTPIVKRGPERWLPKGRSRVPRPKDWLKRKEASVSGSDAAGCETKILDEWLRVRCKQKAKGPKPIGIQIVKGGGTDALTMVWGDTMTLVVARHRGTDLEADFFWKGERRRLTATWPQAEALGDHMTLKKAPEPVPAPPPPDPKTSEALCACLKKHSGAPACDGASMVAHEPCVATWQDDCASMVACAEGDLVYQPRCPTGFVNAGSSHHCIQGP